MTNVLDTLIMELMKQKIKKKVGDTVVELDPYRTKLGTYKAPLQEVRDSL